MRDIKIQIRFAKGHIYVSHENEEETRENYLTYEIVSSNQFFNDVYHFVLLRLKDLFTLMPFENIKVSCAIDEDLPVNFVEKIKMINDQVIKVLDKTNNIIKNIDKDSFSAFDGVMFFGFPKETLSFPRQMTEFSAKWYERFYHYNQNEEDNNVSFYEFPNHCIFNGKERRWIETGCIFFFDQLLLLLKEKKVKKIVYENVYFLDHFLTTQMIYLPAVFEYLGIEAVGMDFDPTEYALMVLKRQMFQNKRFHRFTPYPMFEEKWDNKYQLKNVKYTALADHYEFKETEKELTDDYLLLVISNSRINAVKHHFAAIVLLLSKMDEKDMYREFQLWAWAMRDIIQNRLNITDVQKLHFSGKIFQLFYHVAQFLKYEVIEALETERQIKIYGDQGWGILFPEYYQDKFLSQDEIAEIHAKKENLLLCFNHGVDYLQTSGPVVDSITKDIPFINFPAVVKNEDFSGFKAIEYNNNTELNHLINNACDISKDEALKKSTENYKNVLIQSESEMVDYIFNNKPFPEDGGVYYKEYESHKAILKAEIDDYINKNREFMQECINIFLNDRLENVDINKTRFYNRKYLRRIISDMKPVRR